ncbi:MAG: DUF2845 domain-containing protein [Desulfuromonadaceae bacterium]|nr:DUF2845 domain-containing protein [Desulfuromonadaceae bacterium]
MRVFVVVITASIIFCASLAFADNFRCPNGNIVSTGDSISTVTIKCDPPASSFKREEPVAADFTRADGKPGTKIFYIEVQEWTYTQGSTLLHTLIFRNGILSEVLTGGFVQ